MRCFEVLRRTHLEPAIYDKAQNGGMDKFQQLGEVLKKIDNQFNANHCDQKNVIEHFISYFNESTPAAQNHIKMMFVNALLKRSENISPTTPSSSSSSFSTSDDHLREFFSIANQNRNRSSFFAREFTSTTKSFAKILGIDLNSLEKLTYLSSENTISNELVSKILELVESPNFLPNTPQDKAFISQIKGHITSGNYESLIETIANVKVSSLKTQYYINYQKLLYLCARLIRKEIGTDCPQYKRIINILKNNPHSNFEKLVQKKHVQIAKMLTEKQATRDIEPISHNDLTLTDEEFFESLQPMDVQTLKQETKPLPKLTGIEEWTYAKRLGLHETVYMGTGSVPVTAPSVKRFHEQFKKSHLAARALFIKENAHLLEVNEHERSISRGLATANVSDAKKDKSASPVNHGAIANPYDQKDSTGRITRFRCGSAHTEISAKQYVFKMLLENMQQAGTGDRIDLIDTRYLDMWIPAFGDSQKLRKHRKLIQRVVRDITDRDASNRVINREKLKAMTDDLKGRGLIDTGEEYELNLDALSGKKLKLTSLDLGPTKKNGFALQDDQTVRNVQGLYFLFREKFSPISNAEPEIVQALRDLRKIAFPKEEISLSVSYVAGDKAFYLDELIFKLSEKCGMVTSSGCKSNKDRGSSAFMLHCIIESVFEHRKKISEGRAADRMSLKESRDLYSIKDFELRTEEERQIARNIIFENSVFSMTLLNTGYGGSKCKRLDSLINQAFGSDQAGHDFNKLQEHSKRAAH